MRAVVRRAAFLAALLPSIAAAQSFEYATGTATYRVTQVTKGTQEAMGQKADIETNSNQVVTIALTRPNRDTIAMNIVLDSIKVTNSMGMPTMTEGLVGMKVAAKLSPVGRFYSATGPTEPNAATMTEVMSRFLPALRGQISAGATWSDTTTGKLNNQGIEIDRKVISRYRVQGDTTIGAEKGWKIVRSDSTTLTGSGNTPNGPMTMEGTSKGESSIFVSPKGTLLGWTGTENANIKVLVAANGMEIAITQNATTKVDKIK